MGNCIGYRPPARIQLYRSLSTRAVTNMEYKMDDCLRPYHIDCPPANRQIPGSIPNGVKPKALELASVPPLRLALNLGELRRVRVVVVTVSRSVKFGSNGLD